MSLIVNLPPELETVLAEEAAKVNLSLAEYALRLLAEGRVPGPRVRDGAELVNYWKSEGLIGTRPDVVDPATHARARRENAEQRKRA
jgi:hypothetical protein